MPRPVFSALACALCASLGSWALTGLIEGRQGADSQAMALADRLSRAPGRGSAPYGLAPTPTQERALFALQAAFGGAALGYGLARLRRAGSPART